MWTAQTRNTHLSSAPVVTNPNRLLDLIMLIWSMRVLARRPGVQPKTTEARNRCYVSLYKLLAAIICFFKYLEKTIQVFLEKSLVLESEEIQDWWQGTPGARTLELKPLTHLRRCLQELKRHSRSYRCLFERTSYIVQTDCHGGILGLTYVTKNLPTCIYLLLCSAIIVWPCIIS